MRGWAGSTGGSDSHCAEVPWGPGDARLAAGWDGGSAGAEGGAETAAAAAVTAAAAAVTAAAGGHC